MTQEIEKELAVLLLDSLVELIASDNVSFVAESVEDAREVFNSEPLWRRHSPGHWSLHPQTSLRVEILGELRDRLMCKSHAQGKRVIPIFRSHEEHPSRALFDISVMHHGVPRTRGSVGNFPGDFIKRLPRGIPLNYGAHIQQTDEFMVLGPGDIAHLVLLVSTQSGPKVPGPFEDRCCFLHIVHQDVDIANLGPVGVLVRILG